LEAQFEEGKSLENKIRIGLEKIRS